MKRILHFLLEILGAALICILVGIGLLLVRLDQGDLSLDRTIPEIQTMISDMSPGLDFTIKNAKLEIDQERHAILMRLTDIHVLNQQQEEVGKLEEVSLGFNWRNLMMLTVMPTAIEIIRPSIEITKFPNGYVGFNLQEVEEGNKKSVSITEISDLLKRAPRNLRFIRIVNAELRYNDQKENYIVDAHDGLFVLSRRNNELSGTMNLNIDAKDFKQRVQGTISYDMEKQATQVIVGLKAFQLDQARNYIPEIPADLTLDMPMDILLTTYINGDLQPAAINLQVTGSKGSFNYPPNFAKAIKLKNLLATLDYLPQEKKLLIKTLMVKADKTNILATGYTVKTPQKDDAEKLDTQFRLRALAEVVPLNDLAKYWPESMATDAQQWVTKQIRDGIADTAAIDVQGMVTTDKETILDKMHGRIKFHGLTVDYLPPMTPVKDVDGVALFDANNFNIAVKSGQIFDTKVLGGQVDITGLSEHDQHIDIKTATDGPVKDAITIISSKPLEYAQMMGLHPDQFGGTSKTNLHLNFPLTHSLELHQVGMKTEASLQNVTAQNVVKDLKASAKALDLVVDTNGLNLEGDITLADAPAHVKWQEFFGDDVKQRTMLDMTGTITAATLKGLRLPSQGYFTGTAEAKAHVEKDLKDAVSVTLSADLAKAQITIPELKAEKKSGAAGKLDLNLVTDKDGAITITDSSASWSGFNVSQASIKLNAAQELQSATLKNIRTGRTDASVVVTPEGPNAIRASITGNVVDLSPFWSDKPDPNAKPSTQRRTLSMRAKTLYLHPEIPLSDFRVDVVTIGKDLQRGTISGQTDQGGSLALQQTQDKAGLRHLAIKMLNTGRVLQALDMLQTMRGGTLTLIGDSTPQAPAVVAGKMKIDNFSIVKAPVLARLINALSPGGLLNLLNSNGLSFSKLESNFSLPNVNTIKLSKGKMAGASLGLGFSGYVYRDKDTLSIKGTIIPIEGLNKFVGKIPVLGQILTGLKGEGIIGATYKIKGPSSKPDVTVNPLSALAPGILRSIFFEGDDD